MGWFSPKTTIQVASTVYNMAGDPSTRPNFLKSVVFSAIMSPYDVFIGETIVSNYLRGPGITQRSFFNWSVNNSYPGLPSLTVRKEYEVDPALVEPEITLPGSPAGVAVRVTDAFITSGNFTYWVDQYVYDTYPLLVGTDYLSEYYANSHEILIQFEGGGTEIIPAGTYDVNGDFLIAFHYFYVDAVTDPEIEGTLVTGVTDSGLLPDTTGFTLVSTTNTGNITYDLGGGVFEDFNTILRIYEKTEYLGGSGSNETVTTLLTQINIWEYRYVDAGALHPMYDHRTDTQESRDGERVGDPAVFIYEIGDGNVALDALFEATDGPATPEFYPLIPIRLNNVSILNAAYDSNTGNGLYAEAEAAYKKMSGNQSFADLIAEIEANPDIGDIDYAYVQYGVSLNDDDNTSKKYIYAFLSGMILYQETDEAYISSFVSAVGTFNSDLADYNDWVAAQADSGDPLYGTPRPAYPALVSPVMTTLKLQCADPRLSSSDMRVSWMGIVEDTFAGVGQVGAVSGDLWFVKESDLTWVEGGVTNTMEVTSLYWQDSASTYRKLSIYGLIHQNFIYGGKFVQISAHEALDDVETSGFLVPLHRPTLKDMGLVDATQMALANTYLVFNSYLVDKTYWYETFLGQLLIIILVVVVSVLLSPAAFAGVSGVFGTNIAVGVGLGLAGTAAIIAGAVANTLAAILISTIISEGSKEIFGDKWGSLIGAILGFAFTFGVQGGFQNFNLASFFQPKMLLQLGNALANGFAGFAQAEVAEMAKKTEEAHADFLARQKEINEKMAEFGNDLYFDPMSFTGVNTGNGLGTGAYMPESLDEFIQRTLMTGSDIVDLSIGYIENFRQINLVLPETT